MSNRRGSFILSKHILAELIDLPPGHKILGAEWDHLSDCLRFHVDGPLMPEYHPHSYSLPVQALITLHKQEDGTTLKSWEFKEAK